jgi:tRNA1Val (adenine37-N6)-methyltransferase
MSNPSFRFQQFEVFHDRCGMKVGTDGVLLGVWVHLRGAHRILDVGAGSGLISLILAQRTVGLDTKIVGVEIDLDAALQAQENANRSPYVSRLRIEQSDCRTFRDGFFDLMVSNPPFFRKSLQAPARVRNQARHDESLSYEELVAMATRLLSDEGRLAVVLPYDAEALFEDICWRNCLYVARRCDVSFVEGQAPRRVLLECSRRRNVIDRSILALETTEHQRTDAFLALTSDFYLTK